MRDYWTDGIRRYLLVIALFNLAWEFLHMPLYQLWETGSVYEIAYAAIHCTGGDILIAFFSLIAALVITGHKDWRTLNSSGVVIITVLLGFLYTAFSEWLNIEIRASWAYRDLMPVIPIINMGLSPALQWLVVPLTGFWWVGHRLRKVATE